MVVSPRSVQWHWFTFSTEPLSRVVSMSKSYCGVVSCRKFVVDSWSSMSNCGDISFFSLLALVAAVTFLAILEGVEVI